MYTYYQNKYIIAQILDSALLKRSCNHVTIKMKLLLIKNCFCICVVYMQDLKKKMKVSFFLDFDSSHNWELEI